MVQVAFDSWMITVYDSNQTVTTNKECMDAMKPITKMLPYILMKGGLFESRLNLNLTIKDKVEDFKVKRLPFDKVPQSKKR